VKSEFKTSDEGKWETSAGKFYGDANNKGELISESCIFDLPLTFLEISGLRTTTDYRWYDISAKTSSFSNKGKTLVLQYTVKHEQDLDCGGGYIKIAPSSVNQKKWGGDSDYQIMYVLSIIFDFGEISN
jgi:calreticulin